MKKVYFNLRPFSRERMWDTTKYSSSICNVLLPNVTQNSSVKVNNLLRTSTKEKIKSNIKNNVSKYILNKQNIDKKLAKDADLLYLWGALPKNTSKDFIVEIDNPYTLAYYHANNFNKNKERIRKRLDKAKKITYLSEAAKNHTIELFDGDFKHKSFVIYPYMKDNYKLNNRDSNLINFVFVALDYKRKGGHELLEAFTNIKDNNIRLTFISNTNKNLRNKYKKDIRINIILPQPREVLLNKIYPKMDVMIFPSFQESFGVVLLEALSFGMGLIATNTYATPEMIKNNFNGKLLHHPLLSPTVINGNNIINTVDSRINDFYNRYLQSNEFYYGLYSEIKSSIEDSIDKYKVWQESSVNLFNKKFTKEIWLNTLKNIIN